MTCCLSEWERLFDRTLSECYKPSQMCARSHKDERKSKVKKQKLVNLDLILNLKQSSLIPLLLRHVILSVLQQNKAQRITSFIYTDKASFRASLALSPRILDLFCFFSSFLFAANENVSVWYKFIFIIPECFHHLRCWNYVLPCHSVLKTSFNFLEIFSPKLEWFSFQWTKVMAVVN